MCMHTHSDWQDGQLQNPENIWYEDVSLVELKWLQEAKPPE